MKLGGGQKEGGREGGRSEGEDGRRRGGPASPARQNQFGSNSWLSVTRTSDATGASPPLPANPPCATRRGYLSIIQNYRNLIYRLLTKVDILCRLLLHNQAILSFYLQVKIYGTVLSETYNCGLFNCRTIATLEI